MPFAEIQNTSIHTPEKQFEQILSRNKLTPSIFSEISDDAIDALFGGDDAHPRSARELCINLVNTLLAGRPDAAQKERFRHLLSKLDQRQQKVIEEEDEEGGEQQQQPAVPDSLEQIFAISNKNRKRNKQKKKAKISKAKQDQDNPHHFALVLAEALPEARRRNPRAGSSKSSTYSFFSELNWHFRRGEQPPSLKGTYSGWGASQPTQFRSHHYRRDSNYSVASSSTSSVESEFSSHSTHYKPTTSKRCWMGAGGSSQLSYKKAGVYNTPSSHTLSTTSSSQTPVPQLAKTGSMPYCKDHHEQKRKSFTSAKNLQF